MCITAQAAAVPCASVVAGTLSRQSSRSACGSSQGNNLSLLVCNLRNTVQMCITTQGVSIPWQHPVCPLLHALGNVIWQGAGSVFPCTSRPEQMWRPQQMPVQATADAHPGAVL